MSWKELVIFSIDYVRKGNQYDILLDKDVNIAPIVKEKLYFECITNKDER